MRKLSWQLSLMAALAAVTLSGRTTAVFAADEERAGPGDRLERLERRINEIAQRQEQLMRRLNAEQERQAPGLPGREGMRPPGPLPGLGNAPQPLPPAAAPANPVAQHAWKKIADMVKFCCFMGFIINILIAVWIFTDIRKRGEGSGVFVALALLAGIPTAIIYAIVRIGDKKT